MLREMTWERFRSWQIYDSIEPIGGLRGDLQAGQICAAIMNSLLMRLGVTDDEKHFKAEHFLLDHLGTDSKKKKAESTKPPEKWRHWKMLAKMSAAQANADERRRLKREQRIKEQRERAEERAKEKAAQRQQEAQKRADARAIRLSIRSGKRR